MINYDGVSAKAAFVLADKSLFRGPASAMSLKFDGVSSVAPDMQLGAKPSELNM